MTPLLTRLRAHIRMMAPHQAECEAGQLLIESEKAIAELVDAGRELHDFGDVDVHHRYEDQSRAAFATMAELLRRHEVSQ